MEPREIAFKDIGKLPLHLQMQLEKITGGSLDGISHIFHRNDGNADHIWVHYESQESPNG